jgi:hypothetical protein
MPKSRKTKAGPLWKLFKKSQNSGAFPGDGGQENSHLKSDPFSASQPKNVSCDVDPALVYSGRSPSPGRKTNSKSSTSKKPKSRWSLFKAMKKLKDQNTADSTFTTNGTDDSFGAYQTDTSHITSLSLFPDLHSVTPSELCTERRSGTIAEGSPELSADREQTSEPERAKLEIRKEFVSDNELSSGVETSVVTEGFFGRADEDAVDPFSGIDVVPFDVDVHSTSRLIPKTVGFETGEDGATESIISDFGLESVCVSSNGLLSVKPFPAFDEVGEEEELPGFLSAEQEQIMGTMVSSGLKNVADGSTMTSTTEGFSDPSANIQISLRSASKDLMSIASSSFNNCNPMTTANTTETREKTFVETAFMFPLDKEDKSNPDQIVTTIEGEAMEPSIEAKFEEPSTNHADVFPAEFPAGCSDAETCLLLTKAAEDPHPPDDIGSYSIHTEATGKSSSSSKPKKTLKILIDREEAKLKSARAKSAIDLRSANIGSAFSRSDGGVTNSSDQTMKTENFRHPCVIPPLRQNIFAPIYLVAEISPPSKKNNRDAPGSYAASLYDGAMSRSASGSQVSAQSTPSSKPSFDLTLPSSSSSYMSRENKSVGRSVSPPLSLTPTDDGNNAYFHCGQIYESEDEMGPLVSQGEIDGESDADHTYDRDDEEQANEDEDEILSGNGGTVSEEDCSLSDHDENSLSDEDEFFSESRGSLYSGFQNASMPQDAMECGADFTSEEWPETANEEESIVNADASQTYENSSNVMSDAGFKSVTSDLVLHATCEHSPGKIEVWWQFYFFSLIDDLIRIFSLSL